MIQTRVLHCDFIARLHAGYYLVTNLNVAMTRLRRHNLIYTLA